MWKEDGDGRPPVSPSDVEFTSPGKSKISGATRFSDLAGGTIIVHLKCKRKRSATARQESSFPPCAHGDPFHDAPGAHGAAFLVGADYG